MLNLESFTSPCTSKLGEILEGIDELVLNEVQQENMTNLLKLAAQPSEPIDSTFSNNMFDLPFFGEVQPALMVNDQANDAEVIKIMNQAFVQPKHPTSIGEIVDWLHEDPEEYGGEPARALRNEAYDDEQISSFQPVQSSVFRDVTLAELNQRDATPSPHSFDGVLRPIDLPPTTHCKTPDSFYNKENVTPLKMKHNRVRKRSSILAPYKCPQFTPMKPEKILGELWMEQQHMVFVKWEGKPSCFNSWVERSELKCTELILEFRETQNMM